MMQLKKSLSCVWHCFSPRFFACTSCKFNSHIQVEVKNLGSEKIKEKCCFVRLENVEFSKEIL